jgi:C4-dicarboxylate transporter DctQ subunit
MCFRFVQVLVNFIKSGDLPHHDHSHVEGVDENIIAEILIADTNAPSDTQGLAVSTGDDNKEGKQ